MFLPLLLNLSVLNEYITNIGSFIFIITGIISFFFFVRSRKRGFILLGMGFLLIGTASFVNSYFFEILNPNVFSDTFQISVTSLLIISSLISSFFILAGTFFLYKDKAK